MNIISFSPAATKIIYNLGLAKSLIGRSDYCNFNEIVAKVPTLTRPRTTSCNSQLPVKLLECELYKLEPDYAKLSEIKAQLIILQDSPKNNGVSPEEENKIREKIASKSAEIFTFSPKTFQGIFDETIRLAKKLNKATAGENFTQKMGKKLVEYKNLFPKNDKPKSILVIDNIEPLTVAGYWTEGLLNEIPNIVSLNEGEGKPSRFTTWNEILNVDPDYLFIALNNTGLPETQTILNELNHSDDFRSLRAFKAKKVIIVDGKKHFNLATPEIVETLKIIGQALYPQNFSDNLIGKEWAIYY